MRFSKTTIFGYISAVSSFVVLSQSLSDHSLFYQICVFISSGGLAFLGLTAQDENN